MQRSNCKMSKFSRAAEYVKSEVFRSFTGLSLAFKISLNFLSPHNFQTYIFHLSTAMCHDHLITKLQTTSWCVKTPTSILNINTFIMSYWHEQPWLTLIQSHQDFHPHFTQSPSRLPFPHTSPVSSKYVIIISWNKMEKITATAEGLCPSVV